LTAAAQKKGQIVAAPDGQIAATAKQHGLYVMTRNVKDFEPTGAMLINPWE
jgi:predicted nucleic acid-binding protein